MPLARALSVVTSTRVVILSPLFILIVGFALYFPAHDDSGHLHHEPEANVCRTDACRDLAHIYMENVDLNVSPCDNFYRFACGSANHLQGLPRTRRIAVNPFMDADQSTVQDLVNMVRDSVKYPGTSESMLILRKFYQSCTNSGEFHNGPLSEIKQSILEPVD